MSLRYGVAELELGPRTGGGEAVPAAIAGSRGVGQGELSRGVRRREHCSHPHHDLEAGERLRGAGRDVGTDSCSGAGVAGGGGQQRGLEAGVGVGGHHGEALAGRNRPLVEVATGLEPRGKLRKRVDLGRQLANLAGQGAVLVCPRLGFGDHCRRVAGDASLQCVSAQRQGTVGVSSGDLFSAQTGLSARPNRIDGLELDGPYGLRLRLHPLDLAEGGSAVVHLGLQTGEALCDLQCQFLACNNLFHDGRFGTQETLIEQCVGRLQVTSQGLRGSLYAVNAAVEADFGVRQTLAGTLQLAGQVV